MTKTKTVTATKPSTKENFQIKKIGANIIATFGKEKFSRKVTDQKEIDSILKRGKLYEKKQTAKGKADIIALLTPTTIKAKKEKEKKEVATKAINKRLKKEEKGVVKHKENVIEKKDLLGELEAMLTKSPEAVDELQTLLDKFKKVEEKAPQAQSANIGRRGEY